MLWERTQSEDTITKETSAPRSRRNIRALTLCIDTKRPITTTRKGRSTDLLMYGMNGMPHGSYWKAPSSEVTNTSSRMQQTVVPKSSKLYGLEKNLNQTHFVVW